LYPPSSRLVPLVPPSQRCGLCQTFKQTTLTTRLYKVRTNLYPHLRKRSDAPVIRTYDERKLSFWSSVNGVEKVVLLVCYDSVSGTKEFTVLTYHYDVAIGQSAPNDRKNNITNSFVNTVLLM